MIHSFKVQDKPMNFNVITDNENFIGMVSDSRLQQAFRKLSLVEFWYSSKEDHYYKKRLVKYSFLFQLHICVMTDFLHILNT